MKWLVFAMLVVCAALDVASAQPPADPPSRAVELYEAGKRHFDIAEYGAAIVKWKEAYLLSSEPLLLFNIAQAYRLSGDCAQANRFYANYQRVERDPPNRAELDAATQKCAGIPPATGDAIDAGPTPPTSATPAVTGPGSSAGAAPDPVPVPPSRGSEPRSEHDGTGRTLELTGYIVGGAGAIAGVVAIVSAASARSKAATIDDQPAGTIWTPELAAIERSGKAAQSRARIFGAVSLVALAGGGVLWWMGRERTRARVDVAIGSDHTEVSVSCAF